MPLAFELPLPPSANKIWRRVNGRTMLSEPARRYRETVARIVFAERHQQGALSVARTGLYLPLVERLSVTLSLVPAKNTRRDLDNCFKAVLDALTHAGVWRDDAQIDHLSIDRCPPDPHQPHLKVVVTCLGSPP